MIANAHGDESRQSTNFFKVMTWLETDLLRTFRKEGNEWLLVEFYALLSFSKHLDPQS